MDDHTGVMAVVRGLNEAGIAVTVIDNTGQHYTVTPMNTTQSNAPSQISKQLATNGHVHQNLCCPCHNVNAFNGSSMVEPSPVIGGPRHYVIQTSGLNKTCNGHNKTCQVTNKPEMTQNSSACQAMDGRFASTYQTTVCNKTPTSPPVLLTEFPPQRPLIHKGHANFEVGGMGSGDTSFVPIPSNTYRGGNTWSDRGAVCVSRPSLELNQNFFTRSLRQYPKIPDGRSAEVVERLINYSQARDFGKSLSSNQGIQTDNARVFPRCQYNSTHKSARVDESPTRDRPCNLSTAKSGNSYNERDVRQIRDVKECIRDILNRGNSRPVRLSSMATNKSQAGPTLVSKTVTTSTKDAFRHRHRSPTSFPVEMSSWNLNSLRRRRTVKVVHSHKCFRRKVVDSSPKIPEMKKQSKIQGDSLNSGADTKEKGALFTHSQTIISENPNVKKLYENQMKVEESEDNMIKSNKSSNQAVWYQNNPENCRAARRKKCKDFAYSRDFIRNNIFNAKIYPAIYSPRMQYDDSMTAIVRSWLSRIPLKCYDYLGRSVDRERMLNYVVRRLKMIPSRLWFNKRKIRVEILDIIDNMPLDIPTEKKYKYIKKVTEDLVRKLDNGSIYENMYRRYHFKTINPKKLVRPHYKELEDFVDTLMETSIKASQLEIDPTKKSDLKREVLEILFDCLDDIDEGKEDHVINELISTLEDKGELLKFQAVEFSHVIINKLKITFWHATNCDDKNILIDAIQDETLEKYELELSKQIDNWLTTIEALIPQVRNITTRKTIIKDLIEDILKRRRYLQMSFSNPTTENNEVEHLRFQIFKWVNNLVGENNIQVLEKAPELMKSIKNISVRKNDFQQTNVLLSTSSKGDLYRNQNVSSNDKVSRGSIQDLSPSPNDTNNKRSMDVEKSGHLKSMGSSRVIFDRFNDRKFSAEYVGRDAYQNNSTSCTSHDLQLNVLLGQQTQNVPLILENMIGSWVGENNIQVLVKAPELMKSIKNIPKAIEVRKKDFQQKNVLLSTSSKGDLYRNQKVSSNDKVSRGSIQDLSPRPNDTNNKRPMDVENSSHLKSTGSSRVIFDRFNDRKFSAEYVGRDAYQNNSTSCTSHDLQLNVLLGQQTQNVPLILENMIGSWVGENNIQVLVKAPELMKSIKNIPKAIEVRKKAFQQNNVLLSTSSKGDLYQNQNVSSNDKVSRGSMQDLSPSHNDTNNKRQMDVEKSGHLKSTGSSRVTFDRFNDRKFSAEYVGLDAYQNNSTSCTSHDLQLNVLLGQQTQNVPLILENKIGNWVGENNIVSMPVFVEEKHVTMADVNEQFVKEWIDNVPIPQNITKDQSEAIKAEIYHGVWKILAKLKSSPQPTYYPVLFEDALEEELEKLLASLPQTLDLLAKKQLLKSQFITMASDQNKTPPYHESFRDRVELKVEQEVAKITCDDRRKDEVNYFEELRIHFLVDQYLLYCKYKEEDPMKAEAYRLKLMQCAEDFVRELKSLHGQQLNDIDETAYMSNIVRAMQEVPIPSSEIVEQEADELLLGLEIDKWFSDLPISSNDCAGEQIKRRRLRDNLARNLYVLEGDIDKGNESVDNEALHEIFVVLNKLPLVGDEDLKIKFMAKELINRIKKRKRPPIHQSQLVRLPQQVDEQERMRTSLPYNTGNQIQGCSRQPEIHTISSPSDHQELELQGSIWVSLLDNTNKQPAMEMGVQQRGAESQRSRSLGTDPRGARPLWVEQRQSLVLQNSLQENVHQDGKMPCCLEKPACCNPQLPPCCKGTEYAPQQLTSLRSPITQGMQPNLQEANMSLPSRIPNMHTMKSRTLDRKWTSLPHNTGIQTQADFSRQHGMQNIPSPSTQQEPEVPEPLWVSLFDQISEQPAVEMGARPQSAESQRSRSLGTGPREAGPRWVGQRGAVQKYSQGEDSSDPFAAAHQRPPDFSFPPNASIDLSSLIKQYETEHPTSPRAINHTLPDISANFEPPIASSTHDLKNSMSRFVHQSQALQNELQENVPKDGKIPCCFEKHCCENTEYTPPQLTSLRSPITQGMQPNLQEANMSLPSRRPDMQEIKSRTFDRKWTSLPYNTGNQIQADFLRHQYLQQPRAQNFQATRPMQVLPQKPPIPQNMLPEATASPVGYQGFSQEISRANSQMVAESSMANSNAYEQSFNQPHFTDTSTVHGNPTEFYSLGNLTEPYNGDIPECDKDTSEIVIKSNELQQIPVSSQSTWVSLPHHTGNQPQQSRTQYHQAIQGQTQGNITGPQVMSQRMHSPENIMQQHSMGTNKTLPKSSVWSTSQQAPEYFRSTNRNGIHMTIDQNWSETVSQNNQSEPQNVRLQQSITQGTQPNLQGAHISLPSKLPGMHAIKSISRQQPGPYDRFASSTHDLKNSMSRFVHQSQAIQNELQEHLTKGGKMPCCLEKPACCIPQLPPCCKGTEYAPPQLTSLRSPITQDMQPNLQKANMSLPSRRPDMQAMKSRTYDRTWTSFPHDIGNQTQRPPGIQNIPSRSAQQTSGLPEPKWVSLFDNTNKQQVLQPEAVSQRSRLQGAGSQEAGPQRAGLQGARTLGTGQQGAIRQNTQSEDSSDPFAAAYQNHSNLPPRVSIDLSSLIRKYEAEHPPSPRARAINHTLPDNISANFNPPVASSPQQSMYQGIPPTLQGANMSLPSRMPGMQARSPTFQRQSESSKRRWTSLPHNIGNQTQAEPPRQLRMQNIQSPSAQQEPGLPEPMWMSLFDNSNKQAIEQGVRPQGAAPLEIRPHEGFTEQFEIQTVPTPSAHLPQTIATSPYQFGTQGMQQNQGANLSLPAGIGTAEVPLATSTGPAQVLQSQRAPSLAQTGQMWSSEPDQPVFSSTPVADANQQNPPQTNKETQLPKRPNIQDMGSLKKCSCKYLHSMLKFRQQQSFCHCPKDLRRFVGHTCPWFF